MKNILYLLVLLLVITAGCSKEKVINEIQISDERVAYLIKSFEQNGKSNLKASQVVSADSAIWYLEATANYNYGDASKETNNLVYDSSFIDLNFTSGQITLSEVWSKYEDIIDSLRVSYQKIDSSQKQLIAVNVSAAYLTTSTLRCKVESVFAVGYYNYHLCDFDPECVGWMGTGSGVNNGGTCDGQYLNRDLGTEIQTKIMTCKAVPSGSYYYENEIEILYHAPDFEVPNFNGTTNYMAYYMYYNEEGAPGYNHCLNAEECNFYLNGTKHVIYDTPESLGGPPSNYTFVSVRMLNDCFTGGYTFCQFHTAYVTYAILRFKNQPPQSL